MFFSEKIILDASMETAYIDFSFSLTFRGSGLRKISVSNTNELSESQPGILLSSVSVMPSPSISSSLGSISAIPSPSGSEKLVWKLNLKLMVLIYMVLRTILKRILD